MKHNIYSSKIFISFHLKRKGDGCFVVHERKTGGGFDPSSSNTSTTNDVDFSLAVLI